MRRCTTHALYWSKLWQQDPQNANPDGSTPEGTAQRIGRPFGRLRLWSLAGFQVRATSCHLTSSKSDWKSTAKCTWMCRRVWWSPGAIRWPVVDPGWGSRTRSRPTSPKRPRLGFRRSAKTLYPSLTAPLPRPEPAGLLHLVIRREHHQHDLPQHQSQPDHRHPPSIRRAPAGACGKGMLPVPDPYRGGDWGWRRLYWIVSALLHNQVTWIDFFNKSFKIKLQCCFL